MKKRLLALFLAMSMLIGLMPMSVFAEEEELIPEDIYSEKVLPEETDAPEAEENEQNEAELPDKEESGVLLLGNEEDTETISSGQDWALNVSGVLSIEIDGAMPDYSEKNPAPWHYMAASIREVVLADSVSSIGAYAFSGFSNLTEVTIPIDIEYERNPFSGCPVETIRYTVGKTGIMPDRESDDTWTLECALKDTLKCVEFEEGITRIGNHAFSWGALVYGRCARLTDVKLPSTLKSIGDFAFYNAYSLSALKLPDGLESIGTSAFAYTEKLTELNLPENIVLGENSFAQAGIEALRLPGTVTIGQGAFNNCRSLKEVTIPVDMEYGRNAFIGCPVETIHYTAGKTGIMADREPDSSWTLELAAHTTLKHVDFAEGITQIGNYAYRSSTNITGYCAQLTEVKLPSTLTSIGDYAFYGASALPKIEFPEGLASIGDSAFAYAAELSEIRFNGHAPTIGSNTFLDVTADVFYPLSDSTWTKEKMVNYSGNLNWKVPPLQITKQPENAAVESGKVATFRIEAEGSGISYQWQYSKDGGKLWVNSTAAAAKTATYKTTASTTTDGRLFRCVVTDEWGQTEISDTAQLWLKTALEITKQPADVVTTDGKVAAFSIAAQGTQISYQWQYSKDGGETWVSSTAAAAKTAAYKTTASAGTNGRLFRCIVTDVTGDSVISDVVSLKLKGSIEITAQPEDVIIASGKTAVFRITAEGEGLTYQWQYSKDGGETWVSSTSAAAKTTAYKTTASAGTNGRLFRCVVTDAKGSTEISETAVLELLPEIEITAQPEDVTIASGKTAVFRIAAEGEGLTYQWQYSKDGGETWVSSTSAAAKTTAYKTTASAGTNGRLFRCVVTDAKGSTEISEIAVLELLPEIEITAQPEDVTIASGKTAVFRIAAEGEGLTYQWQYSKDGGETWVSSTSAAAKTTAYKTTASAGTNGRLFRCIVTDANGGSVISEIASLTIAEPVEITMQPEDAEVADDKVATFRIMAEGEGLTYQWQYSKDGGKTWVSSTAAAAKTAVYKTTASASTDGRLFRCIVTDANGGSTTSEIASLTVVYAMQEELAENLADETLLPEEELLPEE